MKKKKAGRPPKQEEVRLEYFPTKEDKDKRVIEIEKGLFQALCYARGNVKKLILQAVMELQ